ncbi:MAG: hypothetical protein JOZ02_01900 [Acidobacteria bacterium]|nr:hypothetical protein [Acidobacteriota bacterium]
MFSRYVAAITLLACFAPLGKSLAQVAPAPPQPSTKAARPEIDTSARRPSITSSTRNITAAAAAAPQTTEFSAAAPEDDNHAAGEAEIAPVLLSYKQAKDSFGRRIADTYAVVQVTIKNPDLTKQFLLQDLTAVLDPNECDRAGEFYRHFDVRGCHDLYAKYFKYPIVYAPVERSALLATASVGQTNNPRNTAIRFLESVGSIGSALTGFDFIGRDGKAGIGIFNGSFLASTKSLFPDMTIGQMSRLTEQSYQPNTVVDSRQSKSFDIFVPTDQLFSKETWKLYRQSTRKAKPEALELRRMLQLVMTVQAKGVHIISADQNGDAPRAGGAPVTDGQQ